MQNLRYSTIIMACILALAGQKLLTAQQVPNNENSPKAPTKQTWDAVGSSFVRFLNSAESNYKQTHGRFASDSELQKAGAMQTVMMNLVKEIGLESLKDFHWNFHVDTSTDGQSYQLSVYRSSMLECQPAFFSSEDGVIYIGERADCPSNQSVLHLKEQSPMSQENMAFDKHPSDLQNKKAPDFTLRDLDGRAVSLAAYRGKAVVINFWATWCKPCATELPWFVDMKKTYASHGLEIIGVDEDSPADEAKVQIFRRKNRINYPIVMDDSKAAKAYNCCYLLPLTYFVGRNGTIVAETSGLGSPSELEANMKKALAAER